MKRSTKKLTDAIFGNSEALDAVLGCFDLDSDTLAEAENADHPQRTFPDFLSQRGDAKRESRKRKMPWLRL